MLLRQLHQRAAGIDQSNVRPNAREGDWGALVNLHLQAIGNEAHDARRFHPWNLFELRFLLGQRDKENIAANVGAHHLHDLRLGDILHAADFDVVARFDPEPPRMLAVVVQSGGGNCSDTQKHRGDRRPQQAAGSFLGKRAAAGGDTLLSAQKRGFLVHIQVNQARVVEFLARRRDAGWVQLLLHDGGTTFSRHQFRVVERNR